MTILTTTTPPNYALWDSSYNGTRLYNRAECHFISFIYQSLNTRSFYVKLVARPPGRGVQKKDQTALPRCQFCGPANCTLIPSGSKKKTMPISGLPPMGPNCSKPRWLMQECIIFSMNKYWQRSSFMNCFITDHGMMNMTISPTTAP